MVARSFVFPSGSSTATCQLVTIAGSMTSGRAGCGIPHVSAMTCMYGACTLVAFAAPKPRRIPSRTWTVAVANTMA
eukprot:3682080-Prymnesium_polylepis.2